MLPSVILFIFYKLCLIYVIYNISLFTMSILLFLSPLIHTRQKKQPNALRSNNRKPSSCFTFSAIVSNPTASLFPQKSPYHTALSLCETGSTSDVPQDTLPFPPASPWVFHLRCRTPSLPACRFRLKLPHLSSFSSWPS